MEDAHQDLILQTKPPLELLFGMDLLQTLSLTLIQSLDFLFNGELSTEHVTILLAMLDSQALTLAHPTGKELTTALVPSPLAQLEGVSTLIAVLMEHGQTDKQMLIVDNNTFQIAVQEIVATTTTATSLSHLQETQQLAIQFQSMSHWFVMMVTNALKIFAIQTMSLDQILAIIIPMELTTSLHTFVLMLNHATTPLAQLTDAIILQSLVMLEISAPSLSAMQPPTTLAFL
jgi:hypothetical protein